MIQIYKNALDIIEIERKSVYVLAEMAKMDGKYEEAAQKIHKLKDLQQRTVKIQRFIARRFQ